MVTGSGAVMPTTNIIDLTPQQLKCDASIKEQIDVLNKELCHLLDGSTTKWRHIKAEAHDEFCDKKKIANTQSAMGEAETGEKGVESGTLGLATKVNAHRATEPRFLICILKR